MAPLSIAQRLRVQQAVLRSLTADRAVHLLARLRYSMPDARPSRFGIRVVTDLPYGTKGRDNHLDVYVPERSSRPMPVVMYVHGGGFSMLSKDTHRVMALAFARRGYLVFNINYRQGYRHVFPAPLEDASEALVWVHRHAAEFGGDPDRLVLAGESAGGNLVAALSLLASRRFPEHYARRLFDAQVPVRATVCTYPFLDLTDLGRFVRHPKIAFWAKDMVWDAACAYLGGHRIFSGEGADSIASPLLALERGFVPERPLPPFFLSVGTKDPLLDDSRRLKRVLDRMGVPCEMLVAPGEIHGYDAMVWRPAAKAKWEAAHRFLAAHLADGSARGKAASKAASEGGRAA